MEIWEEAILFRKDKIKNWKEFIPTILLAIHNQISNFQNKKNTLPQIYTKK